MKQMQLSDYERLYFYTRGHIAKVLGIKSSDIDFMNPAIDEEGKIIGVWVRLKIGKINLVSRGEIGKVFTDKRKAKAKALSTTQNLDDGTKFTVWNEYKNTRYLVQVKRDRVCCECADYQGQVTVFGKKSVCKHGYTALNKLGYESLSDYLNRFPKVLNFWQNGGDLVAKGDAEFTRFHGYA